MENTNKGRNFYLIFSVVGLVISLSVCTMMFFQFRDFTEDSYFTTLEDVAKMVDKLYPAIYDIDAMKRGFRNNEDWIWKMHGEWVDIMNAFGLAYIYYMERDGDEYLEIMDTYYTIDMDPEWIGSEVWEDDPIPPGVHEAWDSQKLTRSPYPSVEEQWGIVESVYYPIVKDGRTIGILGADYNISYINKLRNRILFFLIISFIVSAGLTGVLAFIGSRSVIVTMEEREKITQEAIERQMYIEKLMDALKKSSESRNEFLSDISSSMADPINHIIRLSALLSKYTEIPEDHQKNLEKINDEGMKLFTVINDILDILKIEAGKLKLSYVKYKLPKLINDVASSYLIHIEDKPLQYKLVVEENLPFNLAGDELRIKQICHHILTNAFKYTNTGGVTVNVTGKKKGDYILLVVKVTDTGVGMTEAKIDHILTNYGQGSGKLGLFLCKQLAALMKGSLNVSSEQGKGTVVTFCVPQKILSGETIGAETAKELAAFQFNA